MRDLIKKPGEQGGFILPVLLVTGIMIVLMILAIGGETVVNNNTAAHGNYALEAQLAADAGLDYGINKMNTTTGWTGTASDVPLLNDTSRNLVTKFAVTVNDGADSTHKTLVVTGKTFFPASAASPTVTRKYAMDIEAVTSGNGPSSVSTGVGGLTLENNAKITGGDVVIGGTINMQNNSQIGLSTNPVNVRVADDACPIPANSNYPRVCQASLGDTISDSIVMGGNTVIYGNVQATNQSSASDSKMLNPGHVAGSPTWPGLPHFDRDGFKATVTASGQTLTPAQASACSGNTVNWPANVHISGNVTLPNNCSAQINGNVWIDGSLSFGNKSRLVVQDSLGSTVPDIVIDGQAGVVLGNNATIVPNSVNTGIEMLTFWSAAACSPNCEDNQVTGADLYNSQNVTTITLQNNGSAPNSVLFAYWTKLKISNNGQIGAVAGQTIDLSQNAVINFTSSISGSDNRVTTWVKRGYMRVYS